jgi:phenylpropionate dioxygenase-like ring-hydroxylating dioxygenase large terminal subunit
MPSQQKNSEMIMDAQLFRDYWHLVCHRRELLGSNDFIKFKTPIGDVVVFNDEGNLLAFDNRCAHRGTFIYPNDFGNQPNTCRYHGWTFKNGKLIIPNADQFKACNIDSADLKKYTLEWCGDFLFLGITPKKALHDQLDGIATYLENISFNIDSRRDFSAYEYECYWPLAIENALEPYHIEMVHPKTLASLNLGPGSNEFFEFGSIWKAPVCNKRIEKQLVGLNRFFNIDYQYEGYMSIYMFPFTMISSTYGYSYSVQNFFPSAETQDRTHFLSRLLVPPLKNSSFEGIIDPFFESSSRVNRLVFEGDHSICKLMPRDSWSSKELIYMSEAEAKIGHFRGLCRANNIDA